MRTASLAAILLLLPAAARAQSPAPTATPAASASPISITDPFVIPWTHDSVLACMTFSNASNKVIQGVRFGLHSEQKNPLGSNPTDATIDRVGSFAPGVAIRPPTRFLGTVNRSSGALDNCWEMDPNPVNVKTVVGITVVKVVYADGTLWLNPAPSEAMVSVSY